MQVGEQDPDPPLLAARELAGERTDAGACVEHEGRPVVELQLEAGGVAAVADRRRPRRRQRPAAAPEPGDHPRSPAQAPQKIATMPTNSSAWANSGKAVTEISRATPSRPVTVKLAWDSRRSFHAIQTGRLSSGSNSPALVRGEAFPDHSSNVISPASANDIPISGSAASLKKTSRPLSSAISIGVARLEANSRARIKTRCLGRRTADQTRP